MQDYSQQCFVGPHKVYVLVVALPALLLLVIGYPLVQAVLLWLHMPKSHANRLRGHAWVNYGVLYDQYRPRLFLWGGTIELRKLLLLGLITALRTQSAGAQALAVESGLLLIVLADGWLMPYANKRVNVLHLTAMCAVLQTVHLAVLLPLTAPEIAASATWALHAVALFIDLGVLLILLVLLTYKGVMKLRQSNWSGRGCFRLFSRRLPRSQNP